MNVIARCMKQIPRRLVSAAFEHRHHKISNTGSHSILVALEALKIGRLLGFKKSRLKKLVTAAVWHDMGIVNTEDMYDNWFERNRRHPEMSCDLYKQYSKHYDAKVEDMIATHMWPFGITNVPKSAEAWILDVADDIASVKDRFNLMNEYERNVITDIRKAYANHKDDRICDITPAKAFDRDLMII